MPLSKICFILGEGVTIVIIGRSTLSINAIVQLFPMMRHFVVFASSAKFVSTA